MQEFWLTGIAAGQHRAINILAHFQGFLPKIRHIPGYQALAFFIMHACADPAFDCPKGILNDFGKKINIAVTHADG